MGKSSVLAVLAAVCLAGCAGQHRQLSREEWLSTTARIYSDVDKETVVGAAERLLRLADGQDFKIQHTEDGLLASRNWMSYVVIAAATGTDYWRLTVTPLPEGTKATIQVSMQGSAITPMMTAGPGAGTGWTATSGPMTGAVIDGPLLYDIFWARMDYLLGKKTAWMTCADADALRAAGTSWGNDDPLCNSFNMTDAHPDEKIN